jgi:hypothetical protein
MQHNVVIVRPQIVGLLSSSAHTASMTSSTDSVLYPWQQFPYLFNEAGSFVCRNCL